MAVAPVHCVILTREAEDNAALAALLKAAGFGVVEYPCIETRYLQSEVPRLSAFDAIAFMSRRAVRGAIMNAGADAFGASLLATVGTGGSAELALNGLRAAIVADPPNAVNLAERLLDRLGSGGRVLSVRGNIGLDILKRKCALGGIEVCEWTVYENSVPQMKPFEMEADYAVFASPSAAERFFALNASLVAVLQCVAIGPTTMSAIEKLGVSKVRMARGTEAHDIFECLEEWRNEDESKI